MTNILQRNDGKERLMAVKIAKQNVLRQKNNVNGDVGPDKRPGGKIEKKVLRNPKTFTKFANYYTI